MKKNKIKSLMEKDIINNIHINDIYWNIRERLRLDRNYDDIVQLYKNEINYRMELYFKKEVNDLDININFDDFYKDMIKNKKHFRYREKLSKNLQKEYEKSMNFSCFNFLKKHNYKKKIYNLYNILTIEELNKLNN